MEKQVETLEMFFSALELKKKKKTLYAAAMRVCSDPVGVETFTMLVDAETEHMNQIQKVYEKLLKCAYEVNHIRDAEHAEGLSR
jgi:rubrerythrin